MPLPFACNNSSAIVSPSRDARAQRQPVLGSPGRFTLAAKGTLATLPTLSSANATLPSLSSANLVPGSTILAQGVIGGRRDLEVKDGSGFFVIADDTDHAVLPATANAAAIQTALEGFSGIGAGHVSVAKTFGIQPAGTLSALPTLGVVPSAEMTPAWLTTQSAATTRLTLANTTGFFVLRYGASDVVLPSDSSAFEIRKALQEIPAIGPNNVAVAWNTAGYYEISKNNGTWSLASLGVAPYAFANTSTATLAPPASPSSMRLLTVTGTVGYFLLTDGT